jgi:hypothetical protein
MSSTIPRVRFLINAILNVRNQDGDQEDRLFSSGAYYPVDKIVHHEDGYSDLFLSDGGVIEDVKIGDITELHGDCASVTERLSPKFKPQPAPVAELVKKNLGSNES